MRSLRFGLMAAVFAAVLLTTGRPAQSALPDHGTFSIVAIDMTNGDIGIAISSRVLAVGAETAFAETGIGGVVTQAAANVTFGPKGLALLRVGRGAKEVLGELLDADEGRENRQAAIVDAKGNVAQFTGKECLNWCGGVTGKTYAAQGNILTGEAVVKEMGRAFEAATGQLADKLIAALEAGQAAGGDSRGKQSAHILVVRKNAGYGGRSDRYIDLRVDDHPEPVAELHRILNISLSFQAMIAGANLRVRDKKVDDSIKFDLDALKKYPGSAFLLYDLACGYAVKGDKDQAFDYLGQTIKIRPDAKTWARGDTEFSDEFKADPRWKDLVGAAPAPK